MIPKTEKELDIYEALQNLLKLKAKRHDKMYSSSPGGSHEVCPGLNEKNYQDALKEYLKLAN